MTLEDDQPLTSTPEMVSLGPVVQVHERMQCLRGEHLLKKDQGRSSSFSTVSLCQRPGCVYVYRTAPHPEIVNLVIDAIRQTMPLGKHEST